MAKDFAAGSSTRTHSHPRTQLLYAVRGLMTATTDFGTWLVPEGHALLIPAGVMHRVMMHGPVSMHTAFLSEDALTEPVEDCRIIRILPLLDMLIRALSEEPVDYDLHGRGGHIAALLADEIERAPVARLALPMPRDRRLQTVCQTVIGDLGARVPLDAIADMIGMSRRSFTRRFRDETGISFGDWCGQARLTEALERLARGEPISSVARGLGYSNVRSLQAMLQRKSDRLG
ncbi:AraC family transcriptional regulator [Halovulum dunhuangense]|nr:helix-turn-helix transcriptional regulator [Halovulum dunhuangense]